MVNTSSIHLPSIDFYGFCAERSGGATTPTTPFCEPSVDEPIDSSEKWELQKQMFLAMGTKNMLEISQRAQQLKVVELKLFLQESRRFGVPRLHLLRERNMYDEASALVQVLGADIEHARKELHELNEKIARADMAAVKLSGLPKKMNRP